MSTEVKPSTTDIAYLDEMTGLYNRRFYMKKYAEEGQKAKQNGTPLSLAIVDMDYFKSINDTHGHHKGDMLLVKFSKSLRRLADEQGEDRVFPIRYGGDEFMILMNGIPKEDAYKLLVKLGEETRNTPVTIEGIAAPLKITLSIGLASYPADTPDPEKIFEMADKGVYISKEMGRDRVSTIDQKALRALDKQNLQRIFPCPRMVGRNDLLMDIKRLLVPQPDGLNPIVAIIGKAGIGKSRVLDEIKAQASPRRFFTLQARGLPYMIKQPFGSLIEAVSFLIRTDPQMAQNAVRNLNPEQLQEVSRLIPDLSRYAVMAGGGTSSAERQRGLVASAFVEILLSLSPNKTLLLMIDDMQWCDPGTMQVLQALKEHAKGRAVPVCVALRPKNDVPEENAPLWKMVDDLIFPGTLTQRVLEPLKMSDIQEMLDELLPGLAQDDDLVALLAKRSNGMPLLIEELLKFLIHKDYIIQEGDKITVQPINEADLPAQAQQAIAGRAADLDQEVMDLMNQASVIGQSFDLETLSHLEGMEDKNEGYLLDLLDKAMQAQILQQSPSDSELIKFDFLNTTTRDTIYGGLEEDKKKDLHKQVAQTQEKLLGENLEAGMGALQYHYEKAGEIDKAIQYAGMLSDLYSQILPSLAAVLAASQFLQSGGVPSAPAAAKPAPPEPAEAKEGVQVEVDAKAEAERRRKEWGKENKLSPAEMQQAMKLSQIMRVSIQNFRLFPSHSEIIAGTQEKVHEDLTNLLQSSPTVTFSDADGTFLVNGVEPQVAAGQRNPGADLMAVLTSSGLKGISFKRGIRVEEVKQFLMLLSQRAEEIKAQGGWTAMFETYKIENILINERVFVTVTERDLDFSNKLRPGNIVLSDMVNEDSPQARDQVNELLGQLLGKDEGLAGKLPDLQMIQGQLDKMLELLHRLPDADTLERIMSEGAAVDNPAMNVEMMESLKQLATVRAQVQMQTKGVVPGFVEEVMQDPEIIVRDLESTDMLRVQDAARDLMALGEPATQPLRRLLMGTQNSRARAIAVKVFKRVAPNGLPLLLESLIDTTDAFEKRNLIAALEEFDDPSVMNALGVYIRTRDRDVRREAIRVLTKKNDPMLFDLLVKALDEKDDQIKEDAATALGRLKRRTAVPHLVKFIKRTSMVFDEKFEKVQQACCQALGEIGDPSTVGALVDALGEAPMGFRTKDKEIRAAAAMALSKFPAPLVTNHLKRATESKDDAVRSVARLALKRLEEGWEEAGSQVEDIEPVRAQEVIPGLDGADAAPAPAEGEMPMYDRQ